MQEIASTLRTLLAHNIVSFTYRKVNGEVRHAIGTRNLALAEKHTGTSIPRPKNEEQPNSYYDVERNGWRSYKPELLISIDGVYAREDTDFAKTPTTPNVETKKGELPKMETPANKEYEKHMADIDKILGGIFGGFGGSFSRPTEEEKRAAIRELDKDIDIVPIMGIPATGKVGIGKVGVPTATEKGVALPLGDVSVEDFAKMVAHYVVEELISRIK